MYYPARARAIRGDRAKWPNPKECFGVPLPHIADDANGRTTWIVDAHRGDGKRFVVHAEEKLTAFMELESAVRSEVPNKLYQVATIMT
jgi:hypothetical protein